MESKKIAYGSLIFLSISLFNLDVTGQAMSNAKVDGENRTKELIRHETQPEFVSEIEGEETIYSDYSATSYTKKVLSFTKANTPWKLASFDISKPDLENNLNNYKAIYNDVKNDFQSDVVYYESKTKALFCRDNGSVTPMYFGSISVVGNDVDLLHEVDGCPSCSKNIHYTRSISNNILTIKIQAEDDDQSDVFYVLTFNK
jgi:hypothetical protein